LHPIISIFLHSQYGDVNEERKKYIRDKEDGMRRLTTTVGVVIAVIFITGMVFAEIRVVTVKGDAAYKRAGKWLNLKKGKRLAEGTLISTGARSSAVLAVDKSVLRVRQLTTMKVYAHKITKSGSDTHVGVKYGSVNARIKRVGKLKTRFKVSTPVATSSVRGTEENVFYGVRTGMLTHAPSGTLWVGNNKGVFSRITGNMKFNLPSGKGSPNPLLLWLQNKSQVPIFPDNLTDPEKDFYSNFGGDLGSEPQNPGQVLDQQLKGMASVNLVIEWVN